MDPSGSDPEPAFSGSREPIGYGYVAGDEPCVHEGEMNVSSISGDSPTCHARYTVMYRWTDTRSRPTIAGRE